MRKIWLNTPGGEDPGLCVTVQNKQELVDALTDIYTLDDVQEVVDRVCQCAVSVSPYRVALLSLYFDDDSFTGYLGWEQLQRLQDKAEAKAAAD